MKIAADLHMHSCLSPCGHEDMTPNNIVNMAYIKGLDAIAVSDHNSALNLPATEAVAAERGIVLLPAIEVQTREEVHVLTYFPTVEAALKMGDCIRSKLLPLKNREDLFGPQWIMNENDEKIADEMLLLLQSADISIEETAALAESFSGVAVPAHINKRTHSLIHMLGFIPPNLFTTLEINTVAPAATVDTSEYHLLFSSDAHYLWDISERSFLISVEERSAAGLLDYIKRPRRRVRPR